MTPPILLGWSFSCGKKPTLWTCPPFQFTLIGSGYQDGSDVIVKDPLLKRSLLSPSLKYFWVLWGSDLCPELNSSLYFPKFLLGGKWRLLMLLWGFWTPNFLQSYLGRLECGTYASLFEWSFLRDAGTALDETIYSTHFSFLPDVHWRCWWEGLCKWLYIFITRRRSREE